MSQNYWRRGMASGVTPKYTNMLVYFGVTPDAKPKTCVTPDANPRRQSVEYRWRWVFWCWPCIFHVYFMYISCCLCIIFRIGYAKICQRKGSFQWNMGLSCGSLFIVAKKKQQNVSHKSPTNSPNPQPIYTTPSHYIFISFSEKQREHSD